MRRAGYIAVLFLLILFAGIWTPRLKYISETGRLTEDTVSTAEFRSQPLDEDSIERLRKVSDPGLTLAVYWLESDFGTERLLLTEEALSGRELRWTLRPGWSGYVSACRAVWDDLKYFPVAESTADPGKKVTFEDSWLYGRSYKGERGHEGTDIMASVNERGLYPVVSMTDGVVKNKGWLELGGYRLGIEAPGGAYFYYAHLDSYAQIKEGDEVRAGDLLGYMGDTGYSKIEGTTGKFPVHLHLGIYLYPDGQEISINPWPALKFVEDRRIKASY